MRYSVSRQFNFWAMNFKLFLAAAVVFQILVLSFPIARAAMPAYPLFWDVKPEHEYHEAIMYMGEINLMRGYDNLNRAFLPEQKVNRAEFMKIMMTSIGHLQAEKRECFSDVTFEWFAPYVCAAKERGFVNGYSDGSFRPGQNVTFVEAAKLIVKSAGLALPKVDSRNWYDLYVLALEERGAIPMSIERFDQELTRGEVAEIFWRVDAGITMLPNRKYEELKN